jgi:hypothetical protein
MKKKSLILILLTTFTTLGYSQTSDKKSGFTEVRLSYILSSMSAGGDHFRKDETIIPYGTGLELIFNFSKRFSSDFSIVFRTTGKRIQDTFVISELGYSGPIYHEYTDIHFEIPVHFNFNILNTKPLKILLFSGPKGTVFNSKGHYNPGYGGKEDRYNVNSFGAGLDFGLTEYLKITKKIGIFTSQFYGYYLTGNYSECETLNFKIGLTYKTFRQD